MTTIKSQSPIWLNYSKTLFPCKINSITGKKTCTTYFVNNWSQQFRKTYKTRWQEREMLLDKLSAVLLSDLTFCSLFRTVDGNLSKRLEFFIMLEPKVLMSTWMRSFHFLKVQFIWGNTIATTFRLSYMYFAFLISFIKNNALNYTITCLTTGYGRICFRLKYSLVIRKCAYSDV